MVIISHFSIFRKKTIKSRTWVRILKRQVSTFRILNPLSSKMFSEIRPIINKILCFFRDVKFLIEKFLQNGKHEILSHRYNYN